MQKDRNTFIKSSGVRLSVRIAFLSLLFWSFDFHVVQSHDGQPLTGINFCSDKRNKGRRLNSTVYDNRHAMSQIDCVVQCVYEECCRATNYRKRDSFNGNENCELLHAVASEQPEDLIEVEDYDYTLLLEPEKSFDCRCFSCMHNGICESSTKSCLCVPGFTGKQCEKGRIHVLNWTIPASANRRCYHQIAEAGVKVSTKY